MPHIAVNDIDIYYDIQGKGARLLYIGGTGGDLRNKPSIFESPLVNHFEVLAYDQRGFGQSSKPDVPYSMTDYANDAVGLMDVLGWQKSHVVGISFGGMVTQEMVLAYPDRIERAAMLCTSSGGEGGASYPLHELSDLEVPERAQKMLELSDIRWNKNWQKNNTAIFNTMLQIKISEMTFVENDPSLKLGAERQLEARKQHNTWNRLPTINVPVGVFGGRYDGIALPETWRNCNNKSPAPHK